MHSTIQHRITTRVVRSRDCEEGGGAEEFSVEHFVLAIMRERFLVLPWVFNLVQFSPLAEWVFGGT